ncbi:class I SAM-dependent methyltransferase [Bacillus sp. FJAT-49711]|uniref:class I SAM-dependent methyltransferase n=1 Tax=Bacillus sp. FJAT-49711 TaxID=2833585 RepID=UPI0020168171|nr:class I SAM-dependent methyltransferase [Bacillus sp. FJAT-49711]
MELLKNQYKNSSNLHARISLHELFSTNKKDWHIWLMEQYDIPDNSRILELGCGNGVFWGKNKSRVSNSWRITLSDFSEGMLEDAEKNIGAMTNIKYEQINIVDIPYDDNSFDVVIVNHMLYHVPDIDKALTEVRRVLSPTGKFYTATNGEEHLIEINTLLHEFNEQLVYPRENAKKFGLENGMQLLNRYFSHTHLTNFEGNLEVTEMNPLVQYILSINTNIKEILTHDELQKFNEFIKNKQNQNNGMINITKATGLFTALP